MSTTHVNGSCVNAQQYGSVKALGGSSQIDDRAIALLCLGEDPQTEVVNPIVSSASVSSPTHRSSRSRSLLLHMPRPTPAKCRGRRRKPGMLSRFGTQASTTKAVAVLVLAWWSTRTAHRDVVLKKPTSRLFYCKVLNDCLFLDVPIFRYVLIQVRSLLNHDFRTSANRPMVNEKADFILRKCLHWKWLVLEAA